MLNQSVLNRYKQLAKDLYIEPKEEEVLGSFLLGDGSEYQAYGQRTNTGKEKSTSKNGKSKLELRSKDIRNLFSVYPVNNHEDVRVSEAT